jgi:hypothetical protein
MLRFALSAAALAASMSLAAMPAHADEVACMARFKELVVEGNPDQGPVRLHIFQESAGQKTENYFYSPGDRSGDGMSEPIEPKGMWSLFRDNKMWFSNDGKTWQFGREMDAAADPEAVKDGLRKDAETAANVSCKSEELDGVMHDVVAGEYNSSGLQGAPYKVKYWIRQDTGHVARHESQSSMSGMNFKTLQIVEPWPDLKLPDPE